MFKLDIGYMFASLTQAVSRLKYKLRYFLLFWLLLTLAILNKLKLGIGYERLAILDSIADFYTFLNLTYCMLYLILFDFSLFYSNHYFDAVCLRKKPT